MLRNKPDGSQSVVKGNGFGLDIQINRSIRPKQDSNAASGTPNMAGQPTTLADADALKPGNELYRNVIRPATIGSEEGYDLQLPPSQYVDTVPHYENELHDPALHGSIAALRSADTNVAFQNYDNFAARRMPMPRARQDDGVLGRLPSEADPLMTDQNSDTTILPRDVNRKSLYGANRDGMLKE
jgi:hypothetical protein